MSKISISTWLPLIMAIIFIGTAIWYGVFPHKDVEGATKLLKKHGYTEIHITNSLLWGCSEGDFYRTGFIAKKNGEIFSGCVCGGMKFGDQSTKAQTIRFYD